MKELDLIDFTVKWKGIFYVCPKCDSYSLHSPIIRCQCGWEPYLSASIEFIGNIKKHHDIEHKAMEI